MSIVLIVCIVGWVLNVVVLGIAAKDSPEGAMGMGGAALVAIVPFSLPILFLVSKFSK